jgi:uncharacterized protein YraI
MTRYFLSLITCFLFAAAVVAQENMSGTVYQTANVRSGPDTRFEIVGQLSAGDLVQIDARSSDARWLHVILSNGASGWLPVFALIVEGNVADIPLFEPDESAPDGESTPEPGAPSGVSVISYGRVNVRVGPGISYEILGQLDVDEEADAIARSTDASDWLLIQFDDTEGWVAYFTVRVQGDPTTLPVLVPDTTGQSLVPPSLMVRARFNVRLHPTPQVDTPVTAIVPFDTEVTANGRNTNGDWLLVGFGEETGWGATQLFNIARETVQELPIYDEESS